MPAQPPRRSRTFFRTLALAGAITTGAASGPAFAQRVAVEKPHEADMGRPAEAERARKLLPEVTVDDVNFPDLINYLRDLDPSFQAVVSYSPGATQGGPRIQELKLKNVTADSILQLLAATYPQLRTDAVESPDGKGTIWAIRIERDQRGNGSGGEPTTTVWRLREAVDELESGRRIERKQALEAVMSLVQATLAATPAEGAPASIKLHEATETLVFRGTREQASIVREALDSLRTPQEEKAEQARQTQAKLEHDFKMRQVQLEHQLVRMQDQAQDADRRAAEATRRAEALEAVMRQGMSPSAATQPAQPAAPAK